MEGERRYRGREGERKGGKEIGNEEEEHSRQAEAVACAKAD